MSRKDFEYMAALIADAQLKGAPTNVLVALTDFAVDLGKRTNPRFDPDRFARRIVQLVSEKRPYRYVNPLLGVVLPNPGIPKITKVLSHRLLEVAYRHSEDGENYWHPFKKGVKIGLLSDGNAIIWHPTKRLWKKF